MWKLGDQFLIFLSVKQVTDIADDGFITLMNDSGEQKEDLKLPDGDLGKEIKTKFENGDEIMVTVITAMGEEAVIALKNVSSK